MIPFATFLFGVVCPHYLPQDSEAFWDMEDKFKANIQVFYPSLFAQEEYIELYSAFQNIRSFMKFSLELHFARFEIWLLFTHSGPSTFFTIQFGNFTIFSNSTILASLIKPVTGL